MAMSVAGCSRAFGRRVSQRGGLAFRSGKVVASLALAVAFSLQGRAPAAEVWPLKPATAGVGLYSLPSLGRAGVGLNSPPIGEGWDLACGKERWLCFSRLCVFCLMPTWI